MDQKSIELMDHVDRRKCFQVYECDSVINRITFHKFLQSNLLSFWSSNVLENEFPVYQMIINVRYIMYIIIIKGANIHSIARTFIICTSICALWSGFRSVMLNFCDSTRKNSRCYLINAKIYKLLVLLSEFWQR